MENIKRRGNVFGKVLIVILMIALVGITIFELVISDIHIKENYKLTNDFKNLTNDFKNLTNDVNYLTNVVKEKEDTLNNVCDVFNFEHDFFNGKHYCCNKKLPQSCYNMIEIINYSVDSVNNNLSNYDKDNIVKVSSFEEECTGIILNEEEGKGKYFKKIFKYVYNFDETEIISIETIIFATNYDTFKECMQGSYESDGFGWNITKTAPGTTYIGQNDEILIFCGEGRVDKYNKEFEYIGSEKRVYPLYNDISSTVYQ